MSLSCCASGRSLLRIVEAAPAPQPSPSSRAILLLERQIATAKEEKQKLAQQREEHEKEKAQVLAQRVNVEKCPDRVSFVISFVVQLFVKNKLHKEFNTYSTNLNGEYPQLFARGLPVAEYLNSLSSKGLPLFHR